MAQSVGISATNRRCRGEIRARYEYGRLKPANPTPLRANQEDFDMTKAQYMETLKTLVAEHRVHLIQNSEVWISKRRGDTTLPVLRISENELPPIPWLGRLVDSSTNGALLCLYRVIIKFLSLGGQLFDVGNCAVAGTDSYCTFTLAHSTCSSFCGIAELLMISLGLDWAPLVFLAIVSRLDADWDLLYAVILLCYHDLLFVRCFQIFDGHIRV